MSVWGMMKADQQAALLGKESKLLRNKSFIPGIEQAQSQKTLQWIHTFISWPSDDDVFRSKPAHHW